MRGEWDDELPLKLGPCSNGEFLPQPLGAVEREAIRLTRELADATSHRLAMDRRRFLRSLGGAALMLTTLAACHDNARRAKGQRSGGTFAIPPEATTEPEAARGALTGQEFIFDVQTHFLETDAGNRAAGAFAAAFPQASCGSEDKLSCFSIDNYLDELFLRSDTSMAVISAIPIPGDVNPLSTAHMETARRVFDVLCHDKRLLMHGGAFPQLGRLPAALDAMTVLDHSHDIAAWKVYTHLPSRWWLDDHEADAPRVGHAFLERVGATSTNIVCVHKGFGNLFGAGAANYASPVDIGPAAEAFPHLRFVVYHSGFESGGQEGPYTAATANVGVNRLITTLRRHGIGPTGNVWAELGSTWWFAMRDPTQAAHVLGKLLLQLGPNRILWGTDSIWYGSPQDQIQAFRAFQIAPELQERYGYPALTTEIKRKILGLNAAELYGVQPQTVPCKFTREQLQHARETVPAAFRTYGPTNAEQLGTLLASHGIV